MKNNYLIIKKISLIAVLIITIININSQNIIIRKNGEKLNYIKIIKQDSEKIYFTYKDKNKNIKKSYINKNDLDTILKHKKTNYLVHFNCNFGAAAGVGVNGVGGNSKLTIHPENYSSIGYGLTFSYYHFGHPKNDADNSYFIGPNISKIYNTSKNSRVLLSFSPGLYHINSRYMVVDEYIGYLFDIKFKELNLNIFGIATSLSYNYYFSKNIGFGFAIETIIGITNNKKINDSYKLEKFVPSVCLSFGLKFKSGLL